MLVKNLSCRLPFNTCCTSNKCGKDLKCEIDDKTKSLSANQ
ncbi:hypothetical protein [Wolbachia pipientis]|nr:hypothetical protein [Wolbachia pipientis]